MFSKSPVWHNSTASCTADEWIKVTGDGCLNHSCSLMCCCYILVKSIIWQNLQWPNAFIHCWLVVDALLSCRDLKLRKQNSPRRVNRIINWPTRCRWRRLLPMTVKVCRESWEILKNSWQPWATRSVWHSRRSASLRTSWRTWGRSRRFVMGCVFPSWM